MTIGEVRDAVHATLLCGGEMVDEEVLCACGSDLMSDVLAFSKDTAVLLTGLCNPQSIRTAEMMDVKCILYVRDKKPTLDMISMAEADREHDYIFAAAGFETTAPVYAALIAEAEEREIRNVRLLTALKTMPQAIMRVADGIDGFIAPGHVAVITGTKEYEELAAKLKLPFVISGFKAEELLASIYALVRMTQMGDSGCLNLYPQAVRPDGNPAARERVFECFEKGDAVWRGLGRIAGSGMYLRDKYLDYDSGSRGLDTDAEAPGCKCAEVITGRCRSEDCPLFGKACTIQHPVGACMVSQEGACFIAFSYGNKL